VRQHDDLEAPVPMLSWGIYILSPYLGPGLSSPGCPVTELSTA
jgi:hypothetical protein